VEAGKILGKRFFKDRLCPKKGKRPLVFSRAGTG
jgi:hypothetical protein